MVLCRPGVSGYGRRMRPAKTTSWFTRLAKWTSRAAGRPTTFVGAVGIIVLWAISGPLFGFSDTWQLVINTGTTIVTFLMVFLIQSTQNRDTEALQVKLDELIHAVEEADDTLLDLEELDEKELDAVRDAYQKLASVARSAKRKKERGK
jgi:low affinity Fe/Cu permease